MATIFDISPKEIERLNEHEITDVMNRLLRAENSLLGIPPSNIKTSLRIHDPDAGIDAQIVAPTGIQERWIPEGESIWQFKSGSISRNKLEEELEKKGVREALERGASYCLVIGKDVVPKALNELEGCLKERGIKHKIYNASHVAEWASKHPGIRLLPYFRSLGGLKNLGSWVGLGFFNLPFVPDKQRENIITQLREKLTTSNEPSHIRVEGLPGMGKTRVIYEALNTEGIKESVAYAREPEDVPKQFLTWVRGKNIKLILVVDECDPDEAEKFEYEVNLCNGKVRLITIGKLSTSTTLPPDVYHLDPLEDETVRKLIKKAFPAIPNEAVSFVASHSSGYVKLAELLAKALITNPSLCSTTELAKSYDISQLLRKFLPDEQQKRALKAIAILSRVGWEDEISKEGKAVAEFIDIPWKELQDVAGEMLRKGVVVKKGRYRFITPHLLAIWLAAEVWEDRGRSTLDILKLLPTPHSREAFLERLESLGDNTTIKKIIEEEEIFEREFSDFKSIDNGLKSKIFEKLAICHPEAGLRALQRILSPVSVDELRAFKNGRRHVVRTLEKLAWHPETFEGAARLLLKLAAAENENYTNNATGIWSQLFRIRLSGTSVPALERHHLIMEALKSGQVEYRLLGVEAIGNALKTRDFLRDTSGEIQGGRLVLPEYFPKNMEEFKNAIVSAFKLWDEAFSDSNETVSETAVKALLGKVRGLISSGFFEEVIQRIKLLKDVKEHLKWEVRETLQNILKYEGESLKEHQRNEIEKLIEEFAGNTYKERLRRWIGRLTWQDSDFKGNKHIDMAISLAEEGYGNTTLLKTELEWLTSKEAENIWPFAKRLGELDCKREWLPLIESFVKKGQGELFLAGYMAGRKNAGDGEWVDSKIDDYIDKDRLMAQAVLKVIVTSTPSPSGARRAITLVEKGWLEPVSLDAFARGEWAVKLPKESFYKLVKTILKDEGEQASLYALKMLHHRIRHIKEACQELKDLVFDVLTRQTALLSDATMVNYLWGELAGRYVDLDPIRLAEITVSSLSASESLDDYKLKILVEATKLRPKEVLWNVVGPILLREDKIGYKLLFKLGGISGFGEPPLFSDYAGLLGIDVALEWAESHQPEGPRILAHLTHLGDETGLNPVARELIIRFGNDEMVISALEARFFSGTWIGSEVSYFKSRLNKAEVWNKDTDPLIRKFAEKLVGGLKRDIERAKLVEEEEEMY